MTDPTPTASLAFSAALSLICIIMPSIFNKSSPFVSLRPDKDCGRQDSKSSGQSSSFKNYSGAASENASSKPKYNGDYGKANGHVNGNGVNGSRKRTWEDAATPINETVDLNWDQADLELLPDLDSGLSLTLLIALSL